MVALLGPRKCGKSTLAGKLIPATSPNYFDLEDPESLAPLDEPPRTRGWATIPGRPELSPMAARASPRQGTLL